MNELPPQIVLIYGLAGIRKNNIPLARPPLSPRRILGKIRRWITHRENDKIDNAIRRATKNSFKVLQQFPFVEIQRISDEEMHKVEHIIREFVWKVGLVTRNQQRSSLPYLVQQLAKVSQQFIAIFNDFMYGLNNKWMKDYGIINAGDHIISDLNHLASILKRALDLKLIPREHQELTTTFLTLHSTNHAAATLTLRRS